MADGRRNDGDDLDRRIAAARAAFDPTRGEAHLDAAAESKGWAVGIEFVGSIIVSAFLGYILDHWLHTAPWLMIVLIVLGFGAGLRRAMLASRTIDAQAPAGTSASQQQHKH